MKRSQSVAWHRVGITAFLVGLVVVNSWGVVSTARTTQAAGRDRALPARTARAAALPPELVAALQRDLANRHNGPAPQWPAATPLSPSAIWNQQAEITATNGAKFNNFGWSVALDDNTALVGAIGKNNNTGTAYVFVRSGTKWTQQAELTAADSKTNDQFGSSVALSSGTALIGASGKNNNTGVIYVFVKSGSTWTKQATLTASDGVAGDYFGLSAALIGSTAVIGADGKNSGTGAAYVFLKSGTKWTQQAKLIASDGGTNDYFGSSVALSAGIALIGAPGKNAYTGAAYVFAQSGTRWTQQATLAARDSAPSSNFGSSVALSGGTGLVGAWSKNNKSGAAYVFVQSGTHWTQQAELNAHDTGSGLNFGYSVALSADTALIGAPLRNRNYSGGAYVFGRSGTAWTQQAVLSASDPARGDSLGWSVALSGTTALVGADHKNHGAGAAYVFVR